MTDKQYTVISYYKFIKIKKLFKYKNIFNKCIKDLDIKGIILIAPEGMNLNLSVYSEQYNIFIKKLETLFKFSPNDLKISYCSKHIFKKTKIKVKNEVLTTRLQDHINVDEKIGDYITPNEWDSFINKPDVILVDTRNFYEVEIGSFNNAIDPKAKNFSELLNWLSKYILTEENKKKKIAMFCTGGIRCEKATSYLKNKGHNKIYQLKGGIIKYLETNKDKSSWKGECFVFDNRVSIDKNLQTGNYIICYACRMPLSKEDINNGKYIKGISCHRCYDRKNQMQVNKYKTRNKQSKNINDHE